jgi:hypothetical protein
MKFQVLVISVLYAGCALDTAAPKDCEPIDVVHLTFELTGGGTCKVPPYMTLVQFYCSSARTLEVEQPDSCSSTVLFHCATGPTWDASFYQVSDSEMLGTLDVVGADCAWTGTARAVIKR